MIETNNQLGLFLCVFNNNNNKRARFRWDTALSPHQWCVHSNTVSLSELLLLLLPPVSSCCSSSVGNERSVAWLPFYGQARLSCGEPRGLCHSALMVASAPAARSDSTESSCLSVAVRIPGAVLGHIVLSTVFSQNGSACWGCEVCVAVENNLPGYMQLFITPRLRFAY